MAINPRKKCIITNKIKIMDDTIIVSRRVFDKYVMTGYNK
jgi:hypothetical protein